MRNKLLNILIAPDKFKGSLTTSEVAKAIAVGVIGKYPQANIIMQPMADGGDGSIDVLEQLGVLETHWVKVYDPLFRRIKVKYYTRGETAFIEMAKASGIALLSQEERNCLKTTTLGTGELILHAIYQGCKKINLFIGGSATNDAAIGIGLALGYQFLDKNGKTLSPIGESLAEINYLRNSDVASLIQQIDFQIACDVTNPFFGENGAAYVYAPQKGADKQAVEILDQGLRNIRKVFLEAGMADVQNIPGAGAAGGTGGGLVALLNAKLISGIQMFMEWFDLEQQVKQADFVITGEGQLDEQSLQGKVVGGIAKLCQKFQKPLIVVCGQNKLPAHLLETAYISQVKAIMDYTGSTETAIREAFRFLEMIGGNINFEKWN